MAKDSTKQNPHWGSLAYEIGLAGYFTSHPDGGWAYETDTKELIVAKNAMLSNEWFITFYALERVGVDAKSSDADALREGEKILRKAGVKGKVVRIRRVYYEAPGVFSEGFINANY